MKKKKKSDKIINKNIGKFKTFDFEDSQNPGWVSLEFSIQFISPSKFLLNNDDLYLFSQVIQDTHYIFCLTHHIYFLFSQVKLLAHQIRDLSLCILSLVE
jgi:hypothetical protein